MWRIKNFKRLINMMAKKKSFNEVLCLKKNACSVAHAH